MSLRLCVQLILFLLLIPHAASAEPRDLWLYYSANLLRPENIDQLEKTWRRAAAAGYTRILLNDSKFTHITDPGLAPKYAQHLARVRQLAADLKLEIIPAVFPIGYSNNLLFLDPNLAEGLPVKDALFVVRHNEARLVPDPQVAFAPKPSFADDSVKFTPDGLATVTSNPANARFTYKLKVSPFRCYHVSVDVRTDDYTAEPEVKALAGEMMLQYSKLGAKRTQDWTTRHAVFNSLDHSDVTVYFGVWGQATGRLQWRNWRIEEVGLLNVLRRPGAPLTVRSPSSPLTEGKDFDRISDPHMGNRPWPGEYEVFHEPPTIHTHNLPDGTKLRVSWYHPVTIYDGQVAACLSDPKLLPLLADQVKQLKAAFAPAGFMMSHDELRTANWDDACQKRHLTAGQLLADNVRLCTKLLAGSRTYVWSDMFDPHHNAHDDYYLVRGSLANSWEGLDPSVTIVNWNFPKRDQSLKFFADRGHKQILAGYYDADPSQIETWLIAADRVQGVTGVMYTTWAHNYDALETFAHLVHAHAKGGH